ncbi:hypothetical protein PC129_g20722 [Phytophthora cactorum]|uniref:Uncharacterized protein n=1 Tax=Phytophthora cactorum TaxID=29920 RepID=A0A329RV06_9STRA|nr:hypothetical protein PC112_g21534 [Phytophthora cactorum]KAG2877079.1 hypothetical protein PC114_g23845 [Phytophthora cactorum]KAG3147896.1 hypothetical protein PC128_g23702 [Phytophthora cactorum]KAG3208247.1 hypothetical protein PC129_g20722 [Phytophthora cactorum]KAG4041465.1 hypothetical protein PC123_g23025 [Phytophthora cactorum]
MTPISSSRLTGPNFRWTGHVLALASPSSAPAPSVAAPLTDEVSTNQFCSHLRVQQATCVLCTAIRKVKRDYPLSDTELAEARRKKCKVGTPAAATQAYDAIGSCTRDQSGADHNVVVTCGQIRKLSSPNISGSGGGFYRVHRPKDGLSSLGLGILGMSPPLRCV